jgi:DNA-binding response OmpR family regulator
MLNAMATLAQECAIPPVPVEPEYGRTVLVVEDDRFVREAACEVLRESGFDVIPAQSAAAAQACCFFEVDRVDAVLCDAMLPDGSGIELCRRLVAEKSALRVILASGYPLQYFASTFEKEFHFLSKPYSGELLMAALRFVFTNELQADERLRPHTIADSLQNVPG